MTPFLHLCSSKCCLFNLFLLFPYLFSHVFPRHVFPCAFPYMFFIFPCGIFGTRQDEFHYFGDADRGWAWEMPLWRLSRQFRGPGLRGARFLLMSGTLGRDSVHIAVLFGLLKKSRDGMVQLSFGLLSRFGWGLFHLPGKPIYFSKRPPMVVQWHPFPLVFGGCPTKNLVSPKRAPIFSRVTEHLRKRPALSHPAGPTSRTSQNARKGGPGKRGWRGFEWCPWKNGRSPLTRWLALIGWSRPYFRPFRNLP